MDLEREFLMKEINNFQIWYEYEVLRWPPIMLSAKYDISPARISNMIRKKREIYDNYIVPERWACLPRWNSERDGIFWPPKGDNYGIY